MVTFSTEQGKQEHQGDLGLEHEGDCGGHGGGGEGQGGGGESGGYLVAAHAPTLLHHGPPKLCLKQSVALGALQPACRFQIFPKAAASEM